MDRGDTDGLRHLIEHIQDAVVAFEMREGSPIVRDTNSAFVDIFGYDRGELLGSNLNEYIVPEWLTQEAGQLDQRTDSGQINYRQVRRQTVTGLREFLYRGIPYDGPGVDAYAVYTDLTDVSRKDKQLNVLNRVLRHNLRNEATVISGNAEWFVSEFQADHDGVTERAEMTKEAADHLVSLAEEAGQINTLLASDYDEVGAVDIVPMAQSVASEFRAAYPGVAINTDLPDSVCVCAGEKLQEALAALVENAIVHNPDDDRRVRIHTQSAVEGAWVDLSVDDNGPEIPEQEREVLTGETEISPHRHVSGLGLWLAQWTVERFGGELLFDQSSLGGNRVTLRLRIE